MEKKLYNGKKSAIIIFQTEDGQTRAVDYSLKFEYLPKALNNVKPQTSLFDGEDA